MTSSETRTRHRVETGVWVFYAVFVLLLVAEGGIVHLLGLLWGAVAFVLGGAALGLYELRTIDVERRLRDPILGFGVWIQRRYGLAGYLVNTIVTGGAPGVAVALTKLGHPRRVPLTLLAALLFAAVWVPLWHFAWP